MKIIAERHRFPDPNLNDYQWEAVIKTVKACCPEIQVLGNDGRLELAQYWEKDKNIPFLNRVYLAAGDDPYYGVWARFCPFCGARVEIEIVREVRHRTPKIIPQYSVSSVA